MRYVGSRRHEESRFVRCYSTELYRYPELAAASVVALTCGLVGDGGFVIEFGGGCYQDTYPMYRACIVHVS